MILYVRQEAYYNAVADGRKISRLEEIRQAREENIQSTARRKSTTKDVDSDVDSDELLVEDTVASVIELQEIPMPSIPPGAEYLVAFLHSAGTASSTGMGLIGLSWLEINAWEQATDNVGIVTPRDKETISLLSRVYARESYIATQKGAKPPYIPVVEDEEQIDEIRESVAKRVDDAFASMILAQKER